MLFFQKIRELNFFKNNLEQILLFKTAIIELNITKERIILLSCNTLKRNHNTQNVRKKTTNFLN